MANVLVDREYLENIANAIREKSGTSDLITPADMATAVDDIPVGPTPPPTPVDPADPVGVQYGAVLYYKNGTDGYGVMRFSKGTLNGVDQAKLKTFFTAYPPCNGNRFSYDEYSGGWMYDYYDSGGNWSNMTIPAEMFAQMTGVDFVADEGGGEMMMDRPEIEFSELTTVPADDETEWAICASQSEYNSLAGSTSLTPRSIGGKTIASPYMFKRFVFGSIPTTTPAFFLNYTSIQTIGQIPANITSLGNYFLNYCMLFNSPIHIPASVTTIGEGFLSSCMSFNSALTFDPAGSIAIGNWSMSYMGSFNQPLNFTGVRSIGFECFDSCPKFASNITLPLTLTSIGYQFARGNSNFTGTVYCEAPASISVGDENYGFFYNEDQNGAIYTEGYKVTGTYKQQWYDMYPPCDSYPFRKVTII